MLAQSIVVALLVTGCSVYAAWRLAPAAARRRVALVLLEAHWPAPVAAFLGRHAAAAGACGCDGCDRSTAKPAAPASQAITFHRRVRKDRPMAAPGRGADRSL